MDFVNNSPADGRPLRTLNGVDAYTRECLAFEVDRAASCACRQAREATWSTDCAARRKPPGVHLDHARHVAAAYGVKVDFIQPDEPTQNAHMGSLDGTFRDECLAQERFPTLA